MQIQILKVLDVPVETLNNFIARGQRTFYSIFPTNPFRQLTAGKRQSRRVGYRTAKPPHSKGKFVKFRIGQIDLIQIRFDRIAISDQNRDPPHDPADPLTNSLSIRVPRIGNKNDHLRIRVIKTEVQRL